MDICSLLLLPSFNADNDAPWRALHRQRNTPRCWYRIGLRLRRRPVSMTAKMTYKQTAESKPRSFRHLSVLSPLVSACGGFPFCAQIMIPRARGAAPLVVWSGMMRTIGAISDTHGLLRPQALAALAGCDPIIHAGDVGSPDVLARLGALAPVHAVRGNVDHGAWSANLPVTQ